jgi:addiction module RelE/StbE family toxin
MRIKFSHDFEKMLRLAPVKVRVAFRKRMEVFVNDPWYPLLRNHALKGAHAGTRSINITGDWRALYQERGDVIYFVVLGTHSQLYG